MNLHDHIYLLPRMDLDKSLGLRLGLFFTSTFELQGDKLSAFIMWWSLAKDKDQTTLTFTAWF